MRNATTICACVLAAVALTSSAIPFAAPVAPALAEEGSAEKMRPFDSEEVPLNLEMGEMAMSAGNYEEAAVAFTRAFMLEPKNYAAVYNLGYVSQLRGKNDEAVRYYRQAARLRPEKPEPALNMGVIALASENFSEASAHFAAALKIDPGNESARFNIAMVRMAERKFEEARDTLAGLARDRKAGESGAKGQKPSAPAAAPAADISLKLAQAHLELGAAAEAVSVLEKIETAVPEYLAERDFLLGCALSRAGKAAGSEESFKKAVAAVSGNASLESLLKEKIAEFKKSGTTVKKGRISE